MTTNPKEPEKKPVEKPLSEGARRAQLRSADYETLSPREQWEQDKALGILDWDGT